MSADASQDREIDVRSVRAPMGARCARTGNSNAPRAFPRRDGSVEKKMKKKAGSRYGRPMRQLAGLL